MALLLPERFHTYRRICLLLAYYQFSEYTVVFFYNIKLIFHMHELLEHIFKD